MDNLAHALVGAALGRAVADRHVARAGLIGAVAANAPDWCEIFTGYFHWNRADFLLHHRGITHSLIAAPLEITGLILIIGFGTRWWTRRRGGMPAPWVWLTACVAITQLSHLFMDWQGSYGWRPFLPWDGTWYYLDWVAIADPFFWLVPLTALAWGANRHWLPLSGTALIGAAITFIIMRFVTGGGGVAPWVLPVLAGLCLIAIVGWIAYWFGPVRRQRAALLALLVLACYSTAQGVAVQHRKQAIQQKAQRRFGVGAGYAALTEVGRPFIWEAIYASADTVASDDWRVPRHVDVPLVVRALRETPNGYAMNVFARFLTADVDSTGGAHQPATVYLRDARYARVARSGWAVLSVRME